MNIKTILAISALAILGVAHAKDQQPKSNPSAPKSQSSSTQAGADQKKPATAPESDKAADGGPRLKPSKKWSR